MINDSHPPLNGLRVLDLSRVLAGPFCTQTLGDLGAEVIKVEKPDLGDETRQWGPPFHRDYSAYFLSCNRNKRAMTLDLGQPEGQEVFKALLHLSDVVIDNFLPATAEKLKLTAEHILAIQPRIIMCSISGYGRTGPWAEMPGYDFALQAQSGLMSITGPADGPPFKVGVAITDILAGLHAAIAILACLRAREQSGHGYVIDISLLDCAVAAQANVVQAYLTSGQVPARQGNTHLQIVPYQIFATADSHMVLAIGNDGQWRRFCRVINHQDLEHDERFATNPLRVRHRQELVKMLEPILRERTNAAWEIMLTQAEVPHASVLDYEGVFQHPQVQERGLRVTVKDPEGQPVDLLRSPFMIEGTTLPPPRMPPRQGEATLQILHDLLHLSPEQIELLQNKKVI